MEGSSQHQPIEQLFSDADADTDVDTDFEAVFRSFAVDGRMASSDLPRVLGLWAKSTFDEHDVREALESCQRELFGDQGQPPEGVAAEQQVSFAEAMAVYRRLHPGHPTHLGTQQEPILENYSFASGGSAQPSPLKKALEAVKRGFQKCVKVARRCCHKEKADSQAKVYNQMKPTTKLIILVIVFTFILASAVAGTAVGLNYTSLMAAQQQALTQSLTLVVKAVESFLVTQAQQRVQQSQHATADLLASMINQVGYKMNLRTVTETMLNDVQVSGIIVDNTFEVASKGHAQFAATLLASVMNELCALGSCDVVIPLMNRLNNAAGTTSSNTVGGVLPPGHEAVLVQRGSSSGDLPSVVSELRYCSNGGGGSACDYWSGNGTLQAATASLSNGSSGSFVGSDYVGQAVYGGYSGYYVSSSSSSSSSSNTGVGVGNFSVVYTMRTSTLQAQYLQDMLVVLNKLNAEFTGTTEIMIQQIERPGVPLTVLKMPDQCPHGCGLDSAGAAAVKALYNGGDGAAIDIDYRRTVPIISTATKLQHVNGSLLSEIDVSQIRDNLIRAMTTVSFSSQFSGSMELLLAEQVVDAVNHTVSYAYLVQPKFMANCTLPCAAKSHGSLVDEAMYLATVACQAGVGTMNDYRGVPVLVGYTCLKELGIGVALETDVSSIESDNLQNLISYSDEQNSAEASTRRLLVGMRSASTGLVEELSSTDDYKHACPCTTTFGPLISAVGGGSGTATAADDSGTSVLCAYQYSDALNVGIALKQDMKEVQQPLLTAIGILVGTALGLTILGVLLLALFSQRMLHSIEEAWEKGKKAVEEQSARFESLIAAMYPKFVTEQLVTGTTKIVLELPKATIIFTDIVGFSTTSNQLTAEELLEWIGYTFNVMDSCAQYYKVYKVKNIGDAFFGVAGIPKLVADDEPDDHAFRMLRFASACVQLFSSRYVHPDAGACLEMTSGMSIMAAVAKKMSGVVSNPTFFESKSATGARKNLDAQSSGSGGVSKSAFSSNREATEYKCKMRYGIALGPVTVGVLQGKCPAFDVYGKTVNLASRMESTGSPCHIQCSEAVVQAILANAAHCAVFTFERPHSTYAKGFGNVVAYFVHRARDHPTKELLGTLGIEITVDEYNFDKVMPRGKANLRRQSMPRTNVPGSLAPSTCSSSSPPAGGPDDTIPLSPSSVSAHVEEPPARSGNEVTFGKVKVSDIE